MARWLRMIGLGVVLIAAAVLSFAALRDLAVAVAIDARLAFLLPIAVDAGAAVSCTVWLSPTVQRDARRFACWLTWLLLGATVVGNAAQLGMHANHVIPPWQVAVIVGAIPPAVVGGVVHLLVLVNRATAEPPLLLKEERVADLPVEGLPQLDERGMSRFWETAPPAEFAPTTATPPPKPLSSPAPPTDVDIDRARALIAEGNGRVVLQQELHISEYKAKQLLKTLSTNGHQAS
jgi:hypothetical protein